MNTYRKIDIPEHLQGFFEDCEIGSEPTLQEWVDTMVDVFREVRRVLRDDGTCWINLGDAYAGSGRGGNSGASTMHSPQPDHAKRTADVVSNAQRDSQVRTAGSRGAEGGLKPKDLMGQPWRVAFALQADGWWLRQELIFAKKNPMPESVTDRFTKAHEHVFLLSKSACYYFDLKAIQEEASEGTHARYAQNGGRPPNTEAWHQASVLGPHDAQGLSDAKQKAGLIKGAPRDQGVGRVGGHPGNPAEGERRGAPQYKTPDGWDTRTGHGGHGSFHAEGREAGKVLRKSGNKERKPASARGVPVDTNGKSAGAVAGSVPWEGSTRNPRSVRWIASEPFRGAHFATFPSELIRPFVLAGCPEGGTVLDPFGGSGTTGLVADQEQRNAILIDLDERNAPMATDRITADGPLFADVQLQTTIETSPQGEP